MPELDLTASRRLSLAAEKSGVPLLLLRMNAEPVPSAAETRWRVAAAPSHALPGNAPGMPCFDVELLRCRSRPAGQSWRLEWDRDRKLFRDAALPGAVVPVPLRQQVAETGAEPLRRVA
jgi:protein ImuA